MEPSNIHEDITRVLYKIEEQYSQILQRKERIPTLDVDVVLKDISILYECFLDLREVAEFQRRKALQPDTQGQRTVSQPEAAGKPAEQKKETEKPAVEPAKIAEVRIETGKKAEPVKSSVPKEEPIIQDKPEVKEPQVHWQKTFDASKDKPEAMSKPAASPVSTGQTPVPPQVTAPKVDLLKEREKDFVPTVRKIEFKAEPNSPEPKKESIFEKAASLYDKIAKPTEKTVATQAGKQPISNIKGSIGINEKFIYLKELFRNNTNEYNDALEKLNNFDSYAEAEDDFQELKAKYNWDPEGKSFHGLAELLSRRYLHNA